MTKQGLDFVVDAASIRHNCKPRPGNTLLFSPLTAFLSRLPERYDHLHSFVSDPRKNKKQTNTAVSLAGNLVLVNKRSSTETLSMDFGWGLESHAAQYGIPRLANTNMSTAYSVGGEDLR
jgi:hypothetical protein